MKLSGRTAVVTGAASGIGRAIAQALARRGCHLALADVDESGLAETANQLSGVKVTFYRLDVTDKFAVEAFPARLQPDHPNVHLLVNNAGVALGGTFQEVDAADFEWLFEVNFWGVVRLTRAFLPLLRAADESRIVNLSSIFGIVAPPGQTAYAASKFAVRGFSEALRHELQAEGSPIGITLVHPGGVATSIARNARVPKSRTPAALRAEQQRFQKFLRMPPEEAGEIIVRGIERDRSRVLVGRDARLMALVERLAPSSYWKFLAKGLK